MRILRISLNNLNSLRGRHTVDLTAEPLAGAGLFAITGATGAGKSTLLDALTLALYGRSARYANTANPQDVMSRHCGECSAEVEFAVPAGRFRAVWLLRRARGKPDGTLQPAQRYVYNEANEALTQKINESDLLIERLVGLDYARFLRSAMLAQGEFAQFLKARPAERAELLESLTGTEVYGEIGILAHETVRERKQELEQSQRVLEQIPVITDTERQELQDQIEQTHAAHLDIEQKIEADTAALAAIGRLEEMLREAARLNTERVNLATERTSHRDDLHALQRHRHLEPYIEPLTRFDAAEQDWQHRAAALETTRNSFVEATNEKATAHKLLHGAISAATERARTEMTAATGHVSEASREMSAIQNWLNEHSSDAIIAERHAELVNTIAALRSARQSLSTRWDGWTRRAHDDFPEPASELSDTTGVTDPAVATDTFLAHARLAVQRAQSASAEALRQLRLRQDHLDSARLIAGFEQHRIALEPGKPCPLCGACSHPFVETGTPPSRLAEIAAEVEAATQTEREAARQAERSAAAMRHLESERPSLIETAAECERAESALADEIGALEIGIPAVSQEQDLLDALKQRAEAYRTRKDSLNATERRLTEARQRRIDAEHSLEALDERSSDLDPLPDDTVDGTIAGDPAMGMAIADADRAYRNAKQAADTATVMLDNRTQEECAARTRLETARTEIDALVGDSKFASLEELRDARLSAERVLHIHQFEQDLQRRESRVDTLLHQAEKEIETLRERQVLEGEAAEGFRGELRQRQGERNRLLETLTTLKNRLETDEQNRILRRKREQDLQDARTKLEVWSQLSQLIGSHDGNKFRKFAQSISLDLLTRHANHHLAHLSRRYRICRDKTGELGLQIEDLHQAGALRPMESLSGGESFLASLALALGLSDLAGRAVQIDSLFIDEGFGSLDPETLDVAISALETLQQKRKTVGVISHVSLLKERISTQIVVEKLTGGTSRIRIVG